MFEFYILLIIILLFILIVILVDKYNKKEIQKEIKIKRSIDIEWLHKTKTELEKERYKNVINGHLYNTPPNVNGDFYRQNNSRKYQSPYFNFNIYYSKCIYENSSNCANCTRRREISNANGYYYVASDFCYNIQELDYKD